MRLSFPAALCALLISAFTCQAAGLGDPEVNIPQRLVEASVNQDVAAGDPRVAQTRDLIARVMKATGETEQSVAQVCMRNARYIFDFSRQRVGALEVLEALAKHAPAGKPINDTTQRYFNLRVKEKLGHAEALAAMAAGK
jgi:hypothetical protein